jgi:multiple sugar transport system ATP-binding protein
VAIVVIDDVNGTPVVVSLVEPTGSETHLIARVGTATIVALLRERIGVRPGEPVKL